MTITNTYRWNGKVGSEWNASVPNPPGHNKTNWDNISDLNANPSFPTGAGDLAVIDLGGAINITANTVAGAEEIQIVNASTVTFSSGHFGAGADGEQGGMLIDEDSELIMASSGTMANQGSLDIIGLTGNGTLTVEPNGGFDDLGMIVGADANAHGEVTIDAAFGFIVAQSGQGTGDGVLVVGEDGDGMVDVTDTSVFSSAITILGKNDGSSGEVDLNNSIWGGSSLTIGPAGTGIANIGSGSTVAITNIFVGPNGLLNVTGAAATPGTVLAPILTLGFGTIDVTGGGEVNVGSATGSIGAVSIAGTNLTALGTIKGQMVVGDQAAVQATGSAPGSLLVDGNVHGTGTIEPLMTLEVNGGIDSGVDIAFSPSIGSQVGDLILDVPAANLGTITGFGVGNTIDVMGSQFGDALFTPGISAGAAGTLMLSGNGLTPLQFAVEGDYSPDSFLATPGTSNDTIVTLCFLAGTRIATPHGERPVETLMQGDIVLTLAGCELSAQPVKWSGRRPIDLTKYSQPEKVAPVRIQRGAFADDVPHSDLLLSPDHAIFVDGKLICARQLINGTTIRQEKDLRSIEYFHIELDAHTILLAEGLPVESYLDTGNRRFFANSGEPLVLHPDLTDESDYPTREAGSCAPFVWDEANVRPVWQRLADRAAAIGRPVPQPAITTEANLRVRGRKRERNQGKPLYADGNLALFVLPPGEREFRLISRAQPPTETRPWLEDRRKLGVRVKRIVLRGADELREIPLDHPSLTEGWWTVERDGQIMSRWTDGDAVLPLPERVSSHVILEIHLAGTMTYAVEAERAAA